MPSKALIDAARVRHTALRAADFGIKVGSVEVDFGAVMRRVHRVVEDIAKFEDAEHLQGQGIEVRRGRAMLADATTVAVDGEWVRAERIVIATGSRPRIPPIPGLDAVPYLTNETLFDLKQLPGASRGPRSRAHRAGDGPGLQALGQ